jgi:hypothetical protein
MHKCRHGRIIVAASSVKHTTQSGEPFFGEEMSTIVSGDAVDEAEAGAKLVCELEFPYTSPTSHHDK